jgi:putative ABC transport system permease protein
MFKSYFTIAIRHLTRHKLFSVINIFCLAIGIAFSIIIGVYVLNQIEVNSDIKNLSSQYLVKSKWKDGNMGIDITTLGPLAKTMKDEYPGLVENYYRFDPVGNIVSVGEKHFREDISIGDTTFVTMFGYPLLYGNPKQAFINDQSAVITEDLAIKYFGRKDVINKTITIQTPSDGGKHNYVISAVLKKMSYNSITNFAIAKTEYQVYLSMFNNQYFQGGDKGDNWSNVYMVNMIELKKGVTAKDLEKPFEQTLVKYQPPFVKGNLKIELAKMEDYHLKSNNSAVQKTLTTLSLIAAFILLLAIINFVNINIGTSSYRLKEIGLRKVFGSVRTQLIMQFITESLTLTFIAAIISLFLYQLMIPVFDQLLNTVLDPFWHIGFNKILFLLLLIILVGFISGIYPAFVLSASDTINSVKGKIGSAKGSLLLRKILLVAQFSLTIIIFISTLNISKQVSYFFNKDLGYNKEQVMIISSLPRKYDSVGVIQMENVRSQLLTMPQVKDAALSYDLPDGNGGGYTSIYKNGSNDFTGITIFGTDPNYANVYGIKMKEGIFLSNDNKYIPGQIVINETAEKALGWSSAVGRVINLGAANGTPVTIVGVIKDFNFQSLQAPMQAMMIANLNEPFTRSYRYFSVKLNTTDIFSTVSALENKWKSLFPDAGFEYTFMDEKFGSIYREELQLKKAATIATVLNLIIVFMGIFGIVAFTLTKRTKEIAVRKVLGADARNIIFMFIKDYALLILIANIIAWPVAYIISNKWLQNFTYRVQQNIIPYLIVCGFIFIVVFILVTAQCFKAASDNPVKSLRTE